MDLKLVANTKPITTSPESRRRQKLVRGINRQIGLVKEMIDGQNPLRCWVWRNDEGTYFVPIKYAHQPIELKKGMFSIQCESLDEVTNALTTVRDMANDGQFDSQLSRMSTEIRKKFESQKS